MTRQRYTRDAYVPTCSGGGPVAAARLLANMQPIHIGEACRNYLNRRFGDAIFGLAGRRRSVGMCGYTVARLRGYATLRYYDMFNRVMQYQWWLLYAD